MQPGRVLERITRRADSLRLARHLRIQPPPGLVRIGSDYGGYVLPQHLPQVDWVCYSGGIGEDASFELELIRQYGCEVLGFDPTPRSIRYMQEAAAATPRLRFEPIGLWSENLEQRFYAPADPEHVSHSISNLQQTGHYFTAQCRTVPSLMAEYGHESIDLLKLDIEGAEYAVLASLLDADVRVKVLLVEFHRVDSFAQTAAMVDRLGAAGYRPVHLDRRDVTFVDAALA